MYNTFYSKEHLCDTNCCSLCKTIVNLIHTKCGDWRCVRVSGNNIICCN